jgi:hypothetical protein
MDFDIQDIQTLTQLQQKTKRWRRIFLSCLGLTFFSSWILLPLFILVGTETVNVDIPIIEKLSNDLENGFVYPWIIIMGLSFGSFFITFTAGIRFIFLSQKFSQYYAENFVTKVLSEYADQITYTYKSDYNRDSLREMLLFNKSPISRFSAQDHIIFDVEGKKYTINEVLLKRSSKTDNDRKITYFNGLMISTNYPTSTTETTLVYPKNFPTKNKIGKKVELESVEFEQLFTVYGTDQKEARLHLKTHFMSRLIDFAQANPAKQVFFSITDGTVNLCINNNKDLFKLPIKGVLDIDTINVDIQKEMKLITDLLKGINLRRI